MNSTIVFRPGDMVRADARPEWGHYLITGVDGEYYTCTNPRNGTTIGLIPFTKLNTYKWELVEEYTVDKILTKYGAL